MQIREETDETTMRISTGDGTDLVVSKDHMITAAVLVAAMMATIINPDRRCMQTTLPAEGHQPTVAPDFQSEEGTEFAVIPAGTVALVRETGGRRVSHVLPVLRNRRRYRRIQTLLL